MTEDKLTIEKAREIVSKFGIVEIGPGILMVDVRKAEGFIDGWESRQTEVDELKKEVEKMEEIKKLTIDNQDGLVKLVGSFTQEIAKLKKSLEIIAWGDSRGNPERRIAQEAIKEKTDER